MSGLSQHMLLHIVLMNAAAPLVVLAGRPFARGRFVPSPTGIAAATVLQISLLWALHLPAVIEAGAHALWMHVLAQASLFLAALWFWGEVILASRKRTLQSLLALAVTGKLYCLLGILLIFSPRPLYAGHGMDIPLADQQLAGLMMVVACPASYLVAAVILAARWIGGMERDSMATLPASLRNVR